MILNGAFVTPRDENHFANAGVVSLFPGVLDQGLSTTGSISLGCALVAGGKRVPSPATGKMALVMDTLTWWCGLNPGE